MNTYQTKNTGGFGPFSARLAWTTAASLALFVLAGCGHKQYAPPAMPPPEVGVITVTPTAMPITNEMPGRLAPVRVAQVRARVDGIVLHRYFEQGAKVKAGEVLYQIDPAPFQASYDSAKAALARDKAVLHNAELTTKRNRVLLPIHAISQQNYDDAEAAVQEGRANLLADKAAVEIAGLNLGYSKVTAPIAGRIGAALVTEGALVSQSAATEMAVIQQLNPIYFDFTESSTEVLKLRQELAAGRIKSVAPGEAKVTLVLPDGTIYPQPGKLLFSDITVDPTSGMITLRAEFPNPDDWLLPGMFANARLEQAVAPQALLVPQRGVVISPDGTASVWVVTAADQAESKVVQIGPAAGTNWEIKSGLKAGDHVIVDGLQKIQPGMKVKPVPAETAEGNPAPKAAGK